MRKIVLLIIVLSIFGCSKKISNSSNFNILLDSIIEQTDSHLLISIEFYHTKKQKKNIMIIGVSNDYASAYVDGYAKYRRRTIAFYNSEADDFDIINKQSIISFVDTIIGYNDNCEIATYQKQYFYEIIDKKNIVSTDTIYNLSFYNAVREPRCQFPGVIIKMPEEYWEFVDSIQGR